LSPFAFLRPPQPMNHAFYLTADVTRELRHADLHTLARWNAEEAAARGCHELKNSLPPAPPALLDVLSHSLRQSEYATKYATKVDTIDLVTPFVAAVDSLFPHVRRFDDPLPEDFHKAAKANTSIFCNRIIGLSTFSTQYMAFILLGNDDHLISHRSSVFFPDAFLKRRHAYQFWRYCACAVCDDFAQSA